MYLTSETREIVVIQSTRMRRGARGKQLLVDQYHLAERNENETIPDYYLCGSHMMDSDLVLNGTTVNMRELCERCQKRAYGGPHYLDMRLT